MRNRRESLINRQSASLKTIGASLISIFCGLLLGAVIVFLVSVFSEEISLKGGLEGVSLVLLGVFNLGRNAAGNLTFGFNPTSLGDMLFRAVPLIMTGLSVAVAFQTGLFNIGAPGQYLIGTAASLYTALSLPGDKIPGWIIWFAALLAGMLAGALWGAIPGLLKAFRNINEVLSCIMTNWIAASLVTWFFEVSNLKNTENAAKIGYIRPVSTNGVATAKLGLDRLFPGSQVDGGILAAIVLAVAVYILMQKTTLGYSLRTCGSNRHAARYAGISDRGNIVLSMAIAGGLSGGGAALYWLSGHTEFFWTTYQTLPAAGFNGIPVALLAANHPLGVIFTAMFLSALNIAGVQLKGYTAYNEHVIDIIIGVIVYLSAFSFLIWQWILGKSKKKTGKGDAS